MHNDVDPVWAFREVGEWVWYRLSSAATTVANMPMQRDAVLRIFKRHTKRIAQVPVPRSAPTPLMRLRLDREASRERTHKEMRERCEAIQQLASQGIAGAAIAHILVLHRHTVQKYLAGDTAPERWHTTRKTSALTPYEGYVLERWQGGCRNARQLWREIVAQGYSEAYQNVVRLTGSLRKRAGVGQPLPRVPSGLTPAGATGIVVVRPEKRSTEEQQVLAQLSGMHADLRATLAFFARFAALLRDRDTKEPAIQLDQWMGEAATSGLPEMQAFATKLRQDREAVIAVLTLPYSQEQTEERVNKLKLVKRATYDSVGECSTRARGIMRSIPSAHEISEERRHEPALDRNRPGP